MMCWDFYHVIPGQFEPVHTRYSHILSLELQRFAPVRFAPVRFAPVVRIAPSHFSGNGQARTSSFLLGERRAAHGSNCPSGSFCPRLPYSNFNVPAPVRGGIFCNFSFAAYGLFRKYWSLIG
eukprot:sb/3475928/